MMPGSVLRFTWKACDRLLVLAVLFLPVLWFAGRIPGGEHRLCLAWHPAWLLLPLATAVGLRCFRPNNEALRGWANRLWVQRLCLALAPPFFLLLAAEYALALKKFSYDASPVVFETRESQEDAGNERVLRDPVLLFKFNPGTMYNKVRINSLGYREREIDPVKKPNTVRIICLGDSVTAQGRPNYSGILNDLLQASPPDSGTSWEAFNMGVYGYSSRQGFSVFMEQARALDPDYISILFGANDRNLHKMTDRERMGRRVSGVGGYLSAKLREHRIGQFLAYAGDQVRREKFETENTPLVPRVPPEDYEYILNRFIREARAIGCRPILMTSARRDFSHISVKKGYAVSREGILKRHDDYNDIVRKVAKENGTLLVDLARMLEPPEYDEWFAHDGIHFDGYATEHHPEPPETQPGLTFIAQSLYDVIARDVGH